MIKVAWYDRNKTIVHVQYEGRVETWDEYIMANQQANELAKSVDYPVAFLHTPFRTLMPKGSPLPHIKASIQKYVPPNVVLVATVITNLAAQMLTNTVVNFLIDRRVKSYDSLSQALEAIEAAFKEKEAENV